MLTPEHPLDYDLRDALQGMRQPEPGTVYIADVLAYVEPRLADVRQLTEDRDRLAAKITDFEAGRAYRRLGDENRRLAFEVAQVNGILEGGKKDIEKLVDRLVAAEHDRDDARALLDQIQRLCHMGGQDGAAIRREILDLLAKRGDGHAAAGAAQHPEQPELTGKDYTAAIETLAAVFGDDADELVELLETVRLDEILHDDQETVGVTGACKGCLAWQIANAITRAVNGGESS